MPALRVVFCTTCKNRVGYLRQTLPKNIADNPKSKFVVLNYNDQNGLADYLRVEHEKDINSGQLVVYDYQDSPVFRMAHAKNMAHRCGIREGADILVTLDADNYAGLGFDNYVMHKFDVIPNLSFLSPEITAIPPVGQRFNKDNPIWLGRGFMGRLAIRTNDFIKAGGYNEIFDTWRGEDIDLIERLKRMRLKQGFIDSAYLNAIAHDATVRFQEWPEAQQYENNEIYTLTSKANDTVVNYGKIGCGEVLRNFETTPIMLAPVPTRIFGIGFQRTGTTSLHTALKILGFDSAHWESAAWAFSIWREMNRWGRSGTLEKHQAICDNPIPLLYKKLDTVYPGSKFILTIRDEQSWLQSIEKFWTYEGNPRRWTWDSDGFSHKVHAITYGQVTFDKDVFLARYRQHNQEVKEYFKDRTNLFIFDVEKGCGWEDLCSFLDLTCPSVPYPKADGANDGSHVSPTKMVNGEI